MTRIPRKIFSARWTSPVSGIVSLTRDWTRADPPPLFWDGDGLLQELRMAPPLAFGDESGYFSTGGWVTFCLRASRYPNFDLARSGVYVAGGFNDWQPAFGHRMWRLDAAIVQGQEYYLLNVQKDLCCARGKTPFKFITGRGEWMEVPSGAPNIALDEHGNHNLYIHPFRTGHHQFFFRPPSPIGSTTGTGRVEWREDGYAESALMMPGEYLHSVDSDYEQGVRVLDGKTVFRIFAPRAGSVKVELFRNRDRSDSAVFEAARVDMGTWETSVPGDWHGAYYFYFIDGEPDPFSNFDPKQPILDPFALACAGPEGPAIVVEPTRLTRPEKRFEPPQWQDLIIAEAHVRDLTANAPIEMSADDRLGFTGLAKWVRHPDFPLARLGINAVELQPVQQNDEPTKEGYHWGYMTGSYFAPNCHYALNPWDGSQIDELRDAVAAFHERGMAVLLDVVYNHVGEPNFLQYIDKHYYFDLAADGKYMNWSGCGNTLNCATPMALKLMVKSLS
ncbi:MAG TPA: alpha-amylase family glycosyl hydrolase [Opitutales bacterium]|nr:alpha-amylase family glycosyl hydrolase [Opitutales bacterium]